MARDRDIPPFIHELVYAERHHLLADDIGRAALRTIQCGISDAFSQDLIQNRVRDHRIRDAFEGPFALPRLVHGEVVQGFDLHGRRVLIPVQALNAHALTLGGSGSGKTLKAVFHALQIARLVRGLWLFDCRKNEWARIRGSLRRLGVDMIPLPARRMKINPLQPPRDVAPAEWSARLAALLVQVLALPSRASKVIEIALHRLYDDMQDSGEEGYPTLFDLLERIRADRSLNHPARQAIVDSLEPVILALGPDVLAYRIAWDPSDLARYSINFLLSGLPDGAQNLLLGTLLLSVFMQRVAIGVSNRPMDLYISVDEGQRLISASSARLNALSDLWPLVRGTGIGLDLTIPTSHGVMPEALSFAATKYVGRCGSANDYELFARAMGLTKEQVRHAIGLLRPGRFITQSGELEWRQPYVVDIPHMRFPMRDTTSAAGGETTRLRILSALPSGQHRDGGRA